MKGSGDCVIFHLLPTSPKSLCRYSNAEPDLLEDQRSGFFFRTTLSVSLRNKKGPWWLATVAGQAANRRSGPSEICLLRSWVGFFFFPSCLKTSFIFKFGPRMAAILFFGVWRNLFEDTFQQQRHCSQVMTWRSDGTRWPCGMASAEPAPSVTFKLQNEISTSPMPTPATLHD